MTKKYKIPITHIMYSNYTYRYTLILYLPVYEYVYSRYV